MKSIYIDNNIINEFFKPKHKHLKLYNKFIEQVLTKGEEYDLEASPHSLFEFYGFTDKTVRNSFNIDLKAIHGKIGKLIKDSNSGGENHRIIINLFMDQFYKKIDESKLKRLLLDQINEKQKIVEEHFKNTDEMELYKVMHNKAEIWTQRRSVKDFFNLEAIVSCPFREILSSHTKKTKEELAYSFYADMYRHICCDAKASHLKSIQNYIYSNSLCKDLREDFQEVQLKYDGDRVDSELLTYSVIGVRFFKEKDEKSYFKPVHCFTRDPRKKVKNRAFFVAKFLTDLINDANRAHKQRPIPNVEPLERPNFGIIDCIDYDCKKGRFIKKMRIKPKKFKTQAETVITKPTI